MGRETRVRRSSSAEGGWELAEAPPAPALAGLVRRYVGFVERAHAEVRRLEAPSSTAVLIVNFGVPLTVAGAEGRAEVHAESFIAPVSTQPATTAFAGISAGVQVDFTPIGLHLFCDLALHELPDPSVSLADVLGSEGSLLTEALAEAPNWEERFDLLDSVIAHRVDAAQPATPSVDWAWRTLAANGGRVEINALCAELGCSPRHLLNGFREQVGVPPKAAARILRFERAARLLRTSHHSSLAWVAAESGYHDQAHMTREFRALAGTTPATYRNAKVPGFEGVGAEVNFVQDPAPVHG